MLTLIESIYWALLLVPFAFFFAGCTCCATCSIFSDDFSTDRTGTDYTTVSGSFSVSGGVCTTTSAGALVVANATGTTGHGRVTLPGKVSASGGTFRAVGSYVDSSNYLFAEATINGASSTFKLWKKVSGTDTQLGLTYTFTGSTGTYYDLELCWDGTTASTALTGTTNIPRILATYSGTGNQAGFGASPGAGTATFNNFTFSKDNSDDGTCTDCQTSGICCCGYTMPATMYLDVSGTGPCASCSGPHPLVDLACTKDLEQPVCAGGTTETYRWTVGAASAGPGDPDLFCGIKYFQFGCQSSGTSGIYSSFISGLGGLANQPYTLTVLSCSPFHATGTLVLNASDAQLTCGGAGSTGSTLTFEITE